MSGKETSETTCEIPSIYDDDLELARASYKADTIYSDFNDLGMKK